MAHANARNWRASGPVMGIDLALRYTGIVVYTRDGVPHIWTTIINKLDRPKNAPPITQTEVVQRLIDVANEIIRIAKKYKVKHVAIENYAHKAKFQAHQMGEMAGVVKVQLALACNIVPDVVPPSTARKHTLGYGGSGITKADIKAAVSEGLGIPIEDDHQADAAVIAQYYFDYVAAREVEESFYD